MGGVGSGNRYHWWRSGKKTVVEDCLDLDATAWMREGTLKVGVLASGTWRWNYRSGRSFVVNYELDTLDLAVPSVRLSYSWVWRASPEPQSADYRVRLTTTRPHFGGVRWWFVCPLTVGGRSCNRRVGKLYLPAAARYFGCRRCHDLTYRSAQEHDKRLAPFGRSPELLYAVLDGPCDLATLGLALKAVKLRQQKLEKWERRHGSMTPRGEGKRRGTVT
jgi:hypothetical protein